MDIFRPKPSPTVLQVLASVLIVGATAGRLFAGVAEEAFLKSPSVQREAEFGRSVAMSGDRMVVGAPDEDSGRGAVYVYELADEEWGFVERLVAPERRAGDRFGATVALSGETIAVGVPSKFIPDAAGGGGSGWGVGAVYVFTRGEVGWVEEAYLTASQGGGDDRFGTALSLSGEMLVVGAPGEDSGGADGGGGNDVEDSGAAYVFVRGAGGWGQEQYLKASNTGEHDGFGSAVGVSGDFLVVGAPFEDGNGGGDEGDDSAANAGAAYVFEWSGASWVQKEYVKASNAGAGDVFGTAVAVSEGRLVVGALGEDSGDPMDESNDELPAAGAVYMFEPGEERWQQAAYLKASIPGAEDRFGGRVALSGEVLLVSATGEDGSGLLGASGNNASDSGACYLFHEVDGEWLEGAVFKASNAGARDFFGTAVAVSEGRAVIGAAFEDSGEVGENGWQNEWGARDSGAVYVIDLEAAPAAEIAVSLNRNALRSGGGIRGFGVECVGESAYTRTVEVWNTGEVELTGISAAVLGVEAGKFAIDTQELGLTLAPGGVGRLSVRYLPQALGETAEAILVIESDDADEGLFLLRLEAELMPLQFVEDSRIAPSGTPTQFGTAIAVSGDTVVIGARDRVYVYVSDDDGWVEQAVLEGSNTEANDSFGSAVAIDGDTIVIGAKYEDGDGESGEGDNSVVNAGAVYVFVREGEAWSQRGYLKASNVGASDGFGGAVAVADGTVFVGADGEDSGADDPGENGVRNAGAVYVFEEDGGAWAEVQMLKAPMPEMDVGFGRALGGSSDVVAVGARDSVYVFADVGGGWELETELGGGNTEPGDGFGTSLAMLGDTIVVGAPLEDSDGGAGEDENGSGDSGAVYVFGKEGGSWVEVARLKASNADGNDQFGRSVAIGAGRIVVGAPFEDSAGGRGEDDNSGAQVGAVYTFDLESELWRQSGYLKPSGSSDGRRFGYAVGLMGDEVFTGELSGSSVVHVHDLSAPIEPTLVLEDEGGEVIERGDVLPFGTVGLGGGRERWFTLRNTGRLPLSDIEILFEGENAAFELSRGSPWGCLDVGESGRFWVSYSPELAGDAASRMIISDRYPGSAPFEVGVAGRAPGLLQVVQEAYLKASNADAEDQFGFSVAVSGDTVVVGAYREGGESAGVNGDQSGNGADRSGAVYVYVRGAVGWVQQAYLKASNPEPGDSFGRNVAISGDTVVVGAYREDSGVRGINGDEDDNRAVDSGAAYVFVREAGEWRQQAYLKASNTGAGDAFGRWVSIDGDTIVVGADLEDSGVAGPADNGLIDAGAAYVFEREDGGWEETAFLKAPTPGARFNFGQSVTVSGDVVVVGADQEGERSLPRAGAAYVFVKDEGQWRSDTRLVGVYERVGRAASQFGRSVAIDGDTLVVGAPYEDSGVVGVNGDGRAGENRPDSGAAYIFSREGGEWIQKAYLKASSPRPGDWFGFSVSVFGDTVVVGALNEDGSSRGINGAEAGEEELLDSSGAVYVFQQVEGTWVQRAYIKASNPDAGDLFGYAVEVSGSRLVVGAFQENSRGRGVNGVEGDNGASDVGAAYVFDLDAVFAEAAFAEAARLAGLVGDEAQAGAEPFSDGVSNLMKYGFGLDLGETFTPTGAGAGEGLPVFSVEEVGGDRVLVLEFLRRRGAGLMYVPMKSGDLRRLGWRGFESLPVVTPVDAEWERVRFEEVLGEGFGGRVFGRVEVRLPGDVGSPGG